VALAREDVRVAVDSPLLAHLQRGSVPAHRLWAATLLSVWVQAYNTNLVDRASLPTTYADLLDPRWKGKLGIEAKDQDWFASAVDAMGGGERGVQFFRDLVARNGMSVRLGHTLLTNMVVSGEVPLALTVYNYMPEQAKQKGAPIDWFALEPAIARSNAVGIARSAPHPEAARLFYDYLLGEAQPLFVALNYVPTTVRSLDESEHWTRLFDEVMLRRSGE
jgi:iron(III) transport system substrate-binding protein